MFSHIIIFFFHLEWQYNMIAQACDVNTAVGLARSFSTSSDFFLPPPFRDLDKVINPLSFKFHSKKVVASQLL